MDTLENRKSILTTQARLLSLEQYVKELEKRLKKLEDIQVEAK